MGCCSCCFGFHSGKASDSSSDIRKHCSQEHLLGIPNNEVLQGSAPRTEKSSKSSQLSRFPPPLQRSSIKKFLRAEVLMKDSNGHKETAEADMTNGIKAYSRVPVKLTYYEVRSEDIDGNKIINQYVREHKLGMGSYAKVVLHLSTSDNKLYALKIFHKSRLRKLRVSPTETAFMDVQREVDVMKLLDHPNIVKLVEVIDDPQSDNFYMVLEYVEGSAMFEGCGPPGGIGESTSRRYFRGILAGLLYLHNCNIVHGDIKPENLLVTGEGQIKICDFGRSHVCQDGIDTMRRSPGTPVFSAPECCLGIMYHGKAADIWALGVTLYCMLLGRYPFLGDTLQQIYEKIINEPLFLPDEMSKDLKHLLGGLLCKGLEDPNERLSLVAVSHHPWVCKGYGSLDYKRPEFGQSIAKKYDICNSSDYGVELSNMR